MKRIAGYLIAILLVVWLLPEEAFSRGRSRGSFSRGSWGRSSSSSSRRSSSSWGGSSRSSSWGSKSKSSTPKKSSSSWGSKSSSGWSSRSRTTTRSTSTITKPKVASEADQKAFQKARSSNTFNNRPPAYKSETAARKAAVSDFKQKYEKKYPSTFSTKPSSRPEHIPQRIDVGGRQREVIYRNAPNSTGGYYYQDNTGKWILYSILADRMTRDRYMYRHGYDTTGRYYTRTSYGYERRRSSGWGWFWFALLILVIIVVVAIILYSRKRKKEQEIWEARNRPRGKPKKPLAAVRETTLDKQTQAYWEQITPGDTVTLTDQQTLELLMEARKVGFTQGVDLRVKSTRTIKEERDLMKWHIYELDPVSIRGETSTWFLFIKVVDAAFDVRVMFDAPDFPAGGRDQVLDGGGNFIFLPPPDPDYFDPAELKFAEEIDYSLDDGSQIIYKKKPQGTLFGEMREVPRPSGVRQPQFVTIVEYGATTDCPNPELTIVEVGDPSISSYLVLLQGINVNIHDVNVMLK